MKNRLKIVNLALSSIFIFTGCNQISDKVEKIKKEEDVSIIEKYEEKYNQENEGIVDSIDIEMIDVDDDHVKMYINAKTKDNTTVWSINIGTIPQGIGLENLIAEKCEKYFYYGFINGLEARDIQTGKIAWKNTTDEAKNLYGAQIIETNEKIFIYSYMDIDIIKIFDNNSGKYLKTINLKEIINKNLHKISYKEIYNNDTIRFEVIQDDEQNIIGYLEININTYEVKFKEKTI